MNAVAHGIDLVDIERIQRMLNEHGDRFLQRVFTSTEQEYAKSGGVRCSERLAARFAAKEAVLKAIGTGLRTGMTWTDIEVRVLPSGAPMIATSGRVAEIAVSRGIATWLISISHSGGFAIASVIGISSTQTGDTL
ncbi:MAG: holo-ACP synthase [Planctomycetota bacterium]|nr:holo-ACP synthase [Planctomycetota bacterium]MDA1262276.1 holo-ACP synthase [Planctomycetota bacterium]